MDKGNSKKSPFSSINKWPATVDYKVAIQNPHICFHDSELKSGKAEINQKNNRLMIWAGNLATVYSLRNNDKRWAVKCFHRASPNIQQRYEDLSMFIGSHKLACFVDFEFMDKEILVNGEWYPIVKMEWVDGQSLDKYIESNLENPKKLQTLAVQLTDIVQQLEDCGIAHGDLQHGNILIQNDEIKLLDYDGMFIPAFTDQLSPELGLPSYQHPKRDPKLYNGKMDRFSLLVICASLYGLAADKSLWETYNDERKNLIFSKEDFENVNESLCIKHLLSLKNDKVLQYLIESIVEACSNNPENVHRISLSEYRTIPLKKNQNCIETQLLPAIDINDVQVRTHLKKYPDYDRSDFLTYSEYTDQLKLDGRMPCVREQYSILKEDTNKDPIDKNLLKRKYQEPPWPVRREPIVDINLYTQSGECDCISFNNGPVVFDSSCFTVIEGADFGRVFLLKNEGVLGRSDEADIQIDDEKVSRKHLKISIQRTAGGSRIVVTDLNSKNGLFVNGARAYEQELRNDDKLKVGDTILKFEIKDHLDVSYHDKLYQQATCDPLTGLSNRSYFQNELRKFILIASRFSRAFSVMMLDIDFFKKINESYGHEVGDNALKSIANILMKHVRNHEVVARFGGEEFVMLLPETALNGAVVIAERIRMEVENSNFEPIGCLHRITISIGISEYPTFGVEAEEILKRADEALYHAKTNGRNCVCVSETTNANS